jgi:hypothetical protein
MGANNKAILSPATKCDILHLKRSMANFGDRRKKLYA